MPLIVVVAIVVLISGVFFQKTIVDKSEASLDNTPTSVETYSSPTPIPISTSISPKPSYINPSAIPSPTLSAQNNNLNFKYPNSSEVGSGKYNSSDDSDVITEWYKHLINQLGFNVKSFVKTKANDKVLNKLSAAKNGQNIAIEISKNPGSNVVDITVHIDNN